jgi:hypothetical protein
MIRRYSDDEEVRVRLQARVAEWTRGGWLDRDQAAAIDAQLRTDLRRTNDLLRAALGFFTFVVAVAAIAFVLVTFRFERDDTSLAIVLLVAVVVCLAVADLLVGSRRLYRHGIEESLVLLAIGCACVGTWLLVRDPLRANGHATPLVAGAVVAWYGYLRFGFVYAGVVALALAALVPTQFGLGDHAARLLVAASFGVAFVIARRRRQPHGDEFPGDNDATLQAAACVGVYLALNLALDDFVTGIFFSSSLTHDAFHWATYVATWIVPAVALTLAIRDKDRALLAVGLVEAGITLATNKPYLGIARQSWDPMLFGLLLVVVALAAKRWLGGGVGGQRRGYTADRVAARDRELLTMVSNLSVLVPAGGVGSRGAAPASNEPPAFAGGRSGGGGGGASY